MLDSTLQLAMNLYQETFHFVLEMIQNADDNTYPPNVEPTLMFHLHSNGVLEIINNKFRFVEKDLESICSLRLSSKTEESGSKKKDRSTIGEKGLGFKSIFKVRPCPEIHSNGLHIQFDIAHLFGVIQLTWLLGNHLNQTGAHIMVQVQGTMLQEELQQHLMKLSSNLLLFLKKLQVSKVIMHDGRNQVLSKTLCTAREDWFKKQLGKVELVFLVWHSSLKDWDQAILEIQCQSKLHVFLPTKLYLGTPFFINSCFGVVLSWDTIASSPENK